jgi:hypothetical protein
MAADVPAAPIYPPLPPVRANLTQPVRDIAGAAASDVLNEYYALHAPPAARDGLTPAQMALWDALRIPSSAADIATLADALWNNPRPAARLRRTQALLAALRVPTADVPAALLPLFALSPGQVHPGLCL